jgi:hypothetical protein
MVLHALCRPRLTGAFKYTVAQILKCFQLSNWVKFVFMRESIILRKFVTEQKIISSAKVTNYTKVPNYNVVTVCTIRTFAKFHVYIDIVITAFMKL